MRTFAARMEVIEVIENVLYAIRWPEEDDHELDRMAEVLSDVEYLNAYFNSNSDKLSWFGKTIDEAVVETAKDIKRLIQKILIFARAAEKGEWPDLDDYFTPLHDVGSYNYPRFASDMKGYGIDTKWIRVYAVKCDENFYVITGFGMKLVRTMQEDQSLIEELNKLDKATSFLNKERFL